MNFGWNARNEGNIIEKNSRFFPLRPSKCKKLLGCCLYLHRRTIIIAGRHQIKFSQEISIRTTVTLYTFLFNYELRKILCFTWSHSFSLPQCHPKKKAKKQKRFNARLSFNETFVFWAREKEKKRQNFSHCCECACIGEQYKKSSLQLEKIKDRACQFVFAMEIKSSIIFLTISSGNFPSQIRHCLDKILFFNYVKILVWFYIKVLRKLQIF